MLGAALPLDASTYAQLEAATAEMKSDKFWRDQARPIDAALRAMRDESQAFDKVSAKACRENAIAELEKAKVELDKAAENSLFVPESKLVAAALAQLKGDESAPQAKAESEVAQADKLVLPARPGAASAAAEVFDEAAARETPYTWEQDGEGTVSVRISVPPECGKGDVTVAFKVERLVVTVKGHPLQPVLDSALLYPIVPGDCSWALEGKGAKRSLALSLEKADESNKWHGLVDDEAGRKKKSLHELAQGLEGANLREYGQ